MQIRPAEPQDINGIIALMKSSLGESMIPKSESLWRWKHEENPFGRSYVLVAEENGELIGLRAFMQWKWEWNGKLYRALRAVDTATHPEHQGKGIFKKLTLQQLELCKADGVDFVFNTPNDQSRPGYLKMGWKQQGKMPLKIKLQRPFSVAFAKFFNKNKYLPLVPDPTPEMEWNHKIFDVLKNQLKISKEQLSTPATKEYISWRYMNNPLFRYNYFTDFENYLLICRIKGHSFSKELRLVDYYVAENRKSNISSHIKKQVNQYCKENAIDFISLSGQQYNFHKDDFKWMSIFPVRQIGPIVTLRELNMGEKFESLIDINNWAYSLGDMELF